MFVGLQSLSASGFQCEISHIEVGNIPDFRATSPSLSEVVTLYHWHIDCVLILPLMKKIHYYW